MKPHLQCAEQQVSRSNLTKYCACHAERLTYLIIIRYETSFTMRGATGVTIQPHQILRLSHKMTRMLDRRHIWNLISNARSNRYHDPTSPNTAPATKNDTARFQRKSPKTGETSFPMRGRSDHDPSMIRPWSENENANRNPPRNRGYFSTSPRAFSIVKYNVSRPILHSNLHQVLRLPRKVTLERHQVLRPPRKVTLERHQVLRLPTRLYLTLLYSTWLYLTLLYSTWLYLTLLDSTWLYLTLLDSTWFYLTLVDSTLLDSTGLYLTLLDTTLLDSTWLYLTLLDSAWLCLTLLDSTWLYLTLLDFTWLYLTLLYSTLLDSTLLDSTWHYSTWLYLTLTWLGCRSYIGSFSAKLPLIMVYYNHFSLGRISSPIYNPTNQGPFSHGSNGFQKKKTWDFQANNFGPTPTPSFPGFVSWTCRFIVVSGCRVWGLRWFSGFLVGFLVPLNDGGISSSFHPPEGKEYKWYISGIYCQLGDYMPPTTY